MVDIIFDRILIIFVLGTIGVVCVGLIHRKTVNNEERAEILRSARMRCLDEVTALIRGEDMYSGIGADVKRAYYFAVQAANRKGK